MELDPSTKHDFHRIYNHHEEYSGDEKAEEIEDQIYADVGNCDSLPTATHKGLIFKRVQNGYRFFYGNVGACNIIYAIYHAKEDWQNLILDRYETFSDA
ncbi:hypothetical protein ABUK73_06395 [Agrobacterium sp. BA1120]|uniref:hypothetical protein n=1 Tax=Agrobacterium sp. BA1120 TaxID=3228927 RepID=UPI00336A3BDC